MQQFSISEAIKTGWELFKSQPGRLIGLQCALVGLGIVGMLLQFIPFIGGLASAALSLFITMGSLHIFLHVYDEQPWTVRDLFSQGERFWPFLGMSIIAGFIALGGFALLLIPGIIASIALMFTKLLVIDRGHGVMESIRASWAVTAGHRWHLFLFTLVLGLVNLVGALAFILGLFVTVPVTYLATIHVYRSLLAQATEAQSLPVDTLQTAPKIYMIIGFVVFPLLILVGLIVGALGDAYNQFDQQRALGTSTTTVETVLPAME